MLSVSQDIIDAFSASTRQIKISVDIYFGVSPTTYSNNDYIVNIDLVEEQGADSNTVLGVLSSNELILTLSNLDNRFTPTNTTGPLYGSLVGGLKVEATLSILVAGSWEDLNLGTFYTDKWSPNTSSHTVTVTCYDKLRTILDKPLQASQIYVNNTVEENLQILLDDAGVTYNIESLSYVMPYYFYGNTTLRKELPKFINGFGCRIYMDRNEVLQVKYALSGASVDTFTDDNQIITHRFLQKTNELFSKVELEYFEYAPTDLLTLLFVTLDVTNGTSIFSELTLDSDIIFMLLSVTLDNITSGYVSYVTQRCNNIDLAIVATTSESVDVTIKGYALAASMKTYTKTDSVLESTIGAKTLPLTSNIIQNVAGANTFTSMMLDRVSILGNLLEVQCRGQAALELNDKITISDSTNQISGTYFVWRARYYYDGGLNATYTLFKEVT